MTHEASGFAVLRVDRRGESAPVYLRRFSLIGRNGLRELSFGPRSAAHLFESHAEAADVARRLRRRVPMNDYEYVVEEASRETAASA